MVDKQRIYEFRYIVMSIMRGKGEQDREEFERDFNEILDLALIGLKYKAQLSQEDAIYSTVDCISRQAALDCFHDWIDKYGDIHTADEIPEYNAIMELPSI